MGRRLGAGILVFRDVNNCLVREVKLFDLIGLNVLIRREILKQLGVEWSVNYAITYAQLY